MNQNSESTILKRVSAEFTQRFKKTGRTYFAPSRINIIGEHIDYNGGKVLPCAIEIGTYAIAEKNDLGLLRCYSVNLDEYVEIDVNDLAYKDEYGWANYVSGMVKYILQEGYDAGPMDMIVYGNIPTGAGISSSSSLEMLIGKAINDIYNKNEIKDTLMPIIGQRVENLHIGVNSGIMDQFAINMGKKGKAILLDTDKLEYEYIDADLEDNLLVILNTSKKRQLRESKYNERRAQTEKGLHILQKYVDIKNLCQLPNDDETEALLNKIDDEIIQKRVRHVVQENQRVGLMVQAMQKKDYQAMGKLLNQSHESLKNLYEVTGEELDAICDAARMFEYTYGARMTGAGFGGCAVALVKKEGLEDFEKIVKVQYKKVTGKDAQIIYSDIGSGPKRLS